MEQKSLPNNKWIWWAIGTAGTLGLLAYLNRNRVVNNLKNVQLSENFNLSEFVVTSTGIENIPGQAEVENIRQLVLNVLQPLRTHIKKPIVVSSGFRSSLVNVAIGGAQNSQHVTGQAADISVPGLSNQQIVQTIRILGLPFDQLIDEQLKGKAWVHVSFTSSGRRRQVLTARDGPNGTTTYNTVT